MLFSVYSINLIVYDCALGDLFATDFVVKHAQKHTEQAWNNPA